MLSNDHHILRVQTGDGLVGSRIGVLFADGKMPAGSLKDLCTCLNQSETLRAVPAYHEPTNQHILRISGFRDDAVLQDALLKDWPEWQRVHGKESVVTIDINAFEKDTLDNEVTQTSSALQGFVQEHITSLASIAYIAGNMGILHSAWNTKPDMLKTYTAIAYNTASVFLLATASHADKARDPELVVKKAYDELSASDEKNLADISSKALRFLRNHPWEVCSAMNASGALVHVGSAAHRGQVFEGLAAFGTFVASSLTAFVPEKVARSVDAEMPSDIEGAGTRSTAQGMRRLRAWIEENPLLLSAGIMSVANILYGVAAVRADPIDKGLLTSSLAYLTGNFLQSQASRQQQIDGDDVIRVASSLLRAELEDQNLPPELIEKRIVDFADALVAMPDIAESSDVIADGIRDIYQVEQYLSDTCITDAPTLLKESPFVDVEKAAYSGVVHQETIAMPVQHA